MRSGRAGARPSRVFQTVAQERDPPTRAVRAAARGSGVCGARRDFVKGLGGTDNAAEAVRHLRKACADAGLGGAHFMSCDYGLKPDVAKAVGVDSATIYNLVHWASPKGNPDYAVWAKAAARRFDAAVKELNPIAFFAHASVGWDMNPRLPANCVMPTVLNSTPAKFAEALPRRCRLKSGRLQSREESR